MDRPVSHSFVTARLFRPTWIFWHLLARESRPDVETEIGTYPYSCSATLIWRVNAVGASSISHLHILQPGTEQFGGVNVNFVPLLFSTRCCTSSMAEQCTSFVSQYSHSQTNTVKKKEERHECPFPIETSIPTATDPRLHQQAALLPAHHYIGFIRASNVYGYLNYLWLFVCLFVCLYVCMCVAVGIRLFNH